MRMLGRTIEPVMLWLMGPSHADNIFAQVDSSHAALAIVFACILKPHEPIIGNRSRGTDGFTKRSMIETLYTFRPNPA